MPMLNAGKQINAFLDLIAWSEGTSTSRVTKNNGYDVIVSGVDGPHSFTDYSMHPFSGGRAPIIVKEAQPVEYEADPANPTGPPKIIHGAIPELISTASGRYQITLPTWSAIKELIGAGTFSPQNQDSAALKLLEQCNAPVAIGAGNLGLAFQRVSNTWASFPGNLFGQGGHTADELTEAYDAIMSGKTPL